MSRLTRCGPGNAPGGERRRRILFCLAAILLLIAILPELGAHRFLVINTSPSVAPGLYLRSTMEPTVGQIVDFHIPYPAMHYVQGRTGKDGHDW